MWTAAPMSTRWARSSSNASQVSLRSAERRPSPPSGRTCTKGLRHPPCAGASCRSRSTTSSARHLRRPRGNGTRLAPSSSGRLVPRSASRCRTPRTEPAVRPHQRALVDHCRSVLHTLLEGRVVPVLGTAANVTAFPAAAAPTLGDLRRRRSTSPPTSQGRFGYPPADLVELPRVSQYVAVTHGDGPLWDELHDVLDADYAPGFGARAHRGAASAASGPRGTAAARRHDRVRRGARVVPRRGARGRRRRRVRRGRAETAAASGTGLLTGAPR